MTTRQLSVVLATATLCAATLTPRARAASIGVLRLTDNRQLPNLSLLDPAMNAARNLLIADGHTVTQVSAITAASLANVRILWLPLLDSEGLYSPAERDTLRAFYDAGGRICWIGDAGIYNAGDNSFLAAFNITKLSGTYDTTGPVLDSTTHPVVSGPFGALGTAVAGAATFGLFDITSANVPATAIYTDAAGPGAFVALLDSTPSDGRAALICDSTIFADALDENGGHRPLLRNTIAWLATDSAYTPKGTNIATGQLAGACDACTGVSVHLANVTSTGLTSVAMAGDGRAACDYSIAPFGSLPEPYAGFGFTLATTAGLQSGSPITITLTYNESDLHAAGFADESAIQLFRHDPAGNSASVITTTRDTAANTITGVATGLGSFLLGAVIPATDCDNNGRADVCEIDSNTTAPGGPFYCTTGCDADCNDNGRPDACDVQSHVAQLSESKSPMGAGSPQTFTFTAPPVPAGDVAIDILARGDLSAATEYLDVKLNNTTIGRVFETGGADCTPAPLTARLTLPRATFESLVTNGTATILVTASPAVDPNLCSPVSSVQIRLEYDAENVAADCNGNTVPDECESAADCDADGSRDLCEIASGEATDCNNNTIPDDCDLDSGISEDCNGNETPDECEGLIRVTLVRDPVSGGAVTPPGPNDHDVCAIIPITAAAAPGHCFTGWTVDAGAPPADPQASATTVTADQTKTVTARFTRVITEQPASTMGCPGQSVQFRVEVDPLFETTAAFQWRHNGEITSDPAFSGATTAELTINPLAAHNAGSYDCLVTTNCGTAASAQAQLTLGDNTSITADLADDTAVCRSATATLSITATGVGLTYQWQFASDDDFTNLANGNGITGATTATLTIANAQPDREGHYRCLVTGACGGEAASNATHLSVGEPPAVTAQSPDAILCEGALFTASVTSSGTNLAYGWWFSDGGPYRELLASDPGVSGVNGPTLSITNITAAHAGHYRCIITGDCPNPIQSAPAQLTVRPNTQIHAGPDNLTRCGGQSATFTVAASGAQLAHQWQFDNGDGFTDIPAAQPGITGANSATLVINPVAPSHAGQYRCLVTGACGQPITSTAAQLHVPLVSAITNPALPANASSCPGGRVVFEAVATGESLTYQWQAHLGAAFQNLTNGPTISGAQSPTLVLTGVTANSAGRYQCIVAGACGPALTSREAQLAVTNDVCDCNVNEIADAQDIATATSPDCNANGIPDECEIAAASTAPGGPFHCTTGCLPDCDDNGRPDTCDIADGDATDCNTNSIPDECELAGGNPTADCNANGTPDACDIAAGQSEDCNLNGIPDECDAPYLVDAGDDITLCAAQATATLGGPIVASGSRPPYTYEWQITTGPAGATLSSTTIAHPVFHAAQAGAYTVRLTVRDSTTPPCIKTDDIAIDIYTMSVDAGANRSVGLNQTSPPLTAVATGGTGAVTYEWSIVAGSPSTQLSQFTGDGPNSRTPTFTPNTPGRYTLRVTARDANAVSPCAVSDTLTIDSVLLTIAVPADFAMCVAGQSDLLTTTITSPGLAPHSFEWSIEPGSPDTTLTQFAGNGVNSANPAFKPAKSGVYTIEVTVRDSSTPAAVASQTIRITAGGMQLSLPAEIAECAGPVGIRLPRPNITGGAQPVTYNWTIAPGAPSDEPTQFTDESAFDPAWLFTPDSPGSYTLQLTATDSASPPCVRTTQLLLRATAMTIDAGNDFVTRAFEPSQRLGAFPLVAGAGDNVTYRWQILAGPSTRVGQLSDRRAERPTFTPDDVGTYALQVTADANDSNSCTVTDVVVIEAITAARTLEVNAEGRLFMSLRIDHAHEAAEIRVAGANPGESFTGELADAGSSADSSGLLDAVKTNRQLTLESSAAAGEFVAVVGMLLTEGEIRDASAPIRIHQWDESVAAWRPLSAKSIEAGPFPARPTTADVGRCGHQAMPAIGGKVSMAWVVIDRPGLFTLGASALDAAPILDNNEGAPAPNSPGPISSPSLCGATGGSMALALLLLPILPRRRRPRG